MSKHILMGAINKETNQYEYPRIATKNNKYMCPDCNKDVILRKGNIRVHHFAHSKSENPCLYYDRPGESQIHKDAKMALKLILEQNKDICINRKCNRCSNISKTNIDKTTSTSTSNVKCEHSFNYNNSNKRADVAYLENNDLKYIFEICYKNKTLSNNRPEPWFEIDAENLIFLINNHNDNSVLDINCIRSEICIKCIKIEEEEKEKRRIFLEQEKERNKKLLEEMERLQIKLEEEKKERDNILKIRREKSEEIMSKLKAEHKRCSKCKSWERCKKCVDKLWKKHNEIIKLLAIS